VQGHTSKLLYASHHKSFVTHDILSFTKKCHGLVNGAFAGNMNYITKSTYLIWVGRLIFVFCQYIQHPLPLLVECSIPLSRLDLTMFESHLSNIHRTEC
jgi:hypothetical protein